MNGIPGISVAQAIAEEFTGLDDRDEGISSFEGSKILCRVQVGTTVFQTRVSANVISSSPGMLSIHPRHGAFIKFCILLIETDDR
jgi:hypothetical protein